MKERFKDSKIDGTISITLNKETGKKWTANKATILSAIISVCEDYQSQGYTLTLRQMYYQLVAKDLIPNHDKVYKKLSSLKDEVVYAGLVDWRIFEDRGRIPKRSYFEHSIQDAFRRTKNSYCLNRQLGQPKHIEVWTEKDAISAILERVTREQTIHLVVNKGYSSSTAMYGAYCRFMDAIGKGKKVVILYFGDHDPSGLDMIRDIRERTLFFMGEGSQKKESGMDAIIKNWSEDGDMMSDECYDYINDEDCRTDHFDGDTFFDSTKAFFKHHFEIRPIGLTMDQIEEYNPPHNPAKMTDPRAKWYIEKFGQRSWEVDALRPADMTDIVKDAIMEEVDIDIQNDLLEREEKDQGKIESIIDSLDSE